MPFTDGTGTGWGLWQAAVVGGRAAADPVHTIGTAAHRQDSRGDTDETAEEKDNPVKTLRVRIARNSHVKARTATPGGYEDADADEEPTIWLSSIESFAKLLSRHNRNLLGEIARNRPSSITELAELTGRHKSDLSRTLNEMSRHGLVELVRGPRGTLRPRVRCDRVQVDIPLIGTNPRTDASENEV